MNLFIDTESPVPVYKQIKNQIKGLILQSELPVNSHLPSIRMLAGIMNVANNTVARAYYELEKEGYVKLGGRRGSIVNAIEDINEEERKLFIENLTEEYLLRSKEFTYTVNEIIDLIKKKYEEVY